MKRVVITGMGTINPIGHNVNETWESIKNKECGIQEISLIDSSTYKTKFDAEIKNYDPNEFFDPKTAKRNDRYTQLGMIAAREAVKDSGITPENSDYSRIGTYFSSGIGGLTTIQEQCQIYFEKGNSRISPLFIPMGISNMAAGTIAIEHGFKGESMSIVTACASSAHAIGEAYRAIQLGEEDIILAGGSEASINEVALAGFENMKALTHATEVNRASIPFDAERSGFVMGEGAGAIILEELEHAKARGAKIYAELIGYGSTTDAYHITSPSPDGEGGANAMKRALRNANIKPEEVDYINAHGTSTHLNDAIETKAIKATFGEHAKKLMVSSTKGNTGHLLGGAGGIEAAFLALAIDEGVLPPTINYENPDPLCDLDYVPNEARKQEIEVGMSSSLGFGGHNAVLAFRKYKG